MASSTKIPTVYLCVGNMSDIFNEKIQRYTICENCETCSFEEMFVEKWAKNGKAKQIEILIIPPQHAI